MHADLQRNETQNAWLGWQRFLCLMLLILLSAPHRALIPMNPSTESLTLIVGKSVKRDLTASETHSYAFDISQRRFLQIELYSPNLDLLVSVIAPGGGKSQEWTIAKRAVAPIASILDAPGTFQLRIRNPGKNVNPGSYRMEIKACRSPLGQDNKRVEACRRLSSAARSRSQWTEASLKRAIRDYEEALELWKAVDDRTQEAVILKNTGDVWEILAEWQTAISCYRQAKTIYAQLNDLQRETEINNALSALFINQGEYQQSLNVYVLTPIANEDPWLKAQSLRNRGASYYGMGEAQKATDFLNQALQQYEHLKDRTGQSDVLLYLGYVSHAAKDLSTARQYYQRSLDISRDIENPRSIALALAALGHLSNISGERQEALEYYHQALKIFEIIGERSGRYVVLEGTAYLYAGMGENDKALNYYFTALDLARQAKDKAAEGDILSYISSIYRELGDYQEALQYSQQAVQVYQSMPSIVGESYALENLGKALEGLGRQEKAGESYSRGLEMARQGGDRFLEGLLLNDLGHLHHGSGRLQMALDYYRQALSLQQKANDSVRMPGTLYNLARAESDTGNLDPAIQYAGRGLEITESLRSKVASPELRGSYLASSHRLYECMIDLLMRLRGQRPKEQSDGEALRISEQARARSLLDSLAEARADIRQGADPVLLEQERSLQKSLNAKADLQMQLLKRKHSEAEEKALAEEIAAITAKYDDVRSLIRSTSPHYAALTQPQPLNVQEIQQSVLDSGTLLLEYALGQDRSYLWAVSSDTLRSFDLPRRADIEVQANRVRELMLARQSKAGETDAQYRQRIKKADENYWREAAALSRMLLGPISHQLSSQRLLVVADGALQYVPFGALPKPRSPEDETAIGGPSYTPLIADHEIVNLPSASVLAVLRQETQKRTPAPKMVAVVADPVFEPDDPRVGGKKPSLQPAAKSRLSDNAAPAADLRRAMRSMGLLSEGLTISRLPATREEANSILSLVPKWAGLKVFDFNASRSFAMGPDLGQYRIVHFATHGSLNEEHPELSGLVLSLVDEQGRPQDGFLRLHDIYNLKLPAELVVLSACNSGLGKEVRGEGLVGIVRGFMYAGAARVVASLWKVEDDATAALMKRFYRGMLQEGQTPARALRMAQLDLWKSKQWQSPFYWAAFILQGEWK